MGKGLGTKKYFWKVLDGERQRCLACPADVPRRRQSNPALGFIRSCLSGVLRALIDDGVIKRCPSKASKAISTSTLISVWLDRSRDARPSHTRPRSLPSCRKRRDIKRPVGNWNSSSILEFWHSSVERVERMFFTATASSPGNWLFAHR